MKPTKDQLQDLYTTHNAKQIAELYGVCRRTVYTWTKGYGITRTTNRPTKDELVALYVTHSTSRIADMFGVWPRTVYLWARSYGITRSHKLISDDVALQVRDLYRHTRMSQKEIGDCYGLAQGTVSALVSSVDIPCKPAINHNMRLALGLPV